jgi:N utilization substance protein A
MASAISANRAELLAIANAVAAEKMIDKSIVIEAMEEAIEVGAQPLWRRERHPRQARSAYRRPPVARGRSGRACRGLLQAGRSQAGRKLRPAPRWQFHRRSAAAVDWAIDAVGQAGHLPEGPRRRRDRQYDEFKDRAGEIITGVIKSVEFGHVINLGRAEA